MISNMIVPHQPGIRRPFDGLRLINRLRQTTSRDVSIFKLYGGVWDKATINLTLNTFPHSEAVGVAGNA